LNLYDRDMVLFSGKGGVGKTTAAAGFALSCARRGERTLLIELNVKDRVSAYFGSQEVGSEIVEIEDDLHAVNVRPDAALEEYGLMMLRVKFIYRAVFENRVVRSLLNAIPGLDDLVMLGKAYYHATETDDRGEQVWDKVVVDAPATGHGLFMLQIPMVISQSISSGHMHEEANDILELLRDPERTALNLVTLPEEMPVNETLMLRDEIRQKLEMPLGWVVANGVYSPLFTSEETQWIDAAHPHTRSHGDPAIRGMINAAAFRSQRVELQGEYIDKLRHEVDQPILQIPYFFTNRVTFPQIERIAKRFEAAITDGDKQPLQAAQPPGAE
jgi:anion-transporting  ArsA/GET3 family ATPase